MRTFLGHEEQRKQFTSNNFNMVEPAGNVEEFSKVLQLLRGGVKKKLRAQR